MKILSLATIRFYLKAHQKRLRGGDELPTFKAIADLAGVHRDTLYALISGDKINERSQYAITKALIEVMESHCNQPSRLLSIDLGSDGPRLKFGFANKSILSQR